VFADAVPVSRQCRDAALRLDLGPYELRLAGGEDYELLATVDPDAAEAVCEAIWARGHVECVMIGVLTAGDEIQVLDEAGYPLEAVPAGWEHFRG
jgi:thiamine-monophosphate kinase